MFGKEISPYRKWSLPRFVGTTRRRVGRNRRNGDWSYCEEADSREKLLRERTRHTGTHALGRWCWSLISPPSPPYPNLTTYPQHKTTPAGGRFDNDSATASPANGIRLTHVLDARAKGWSISMHYGNPADPVEAKKMHPEGCISRRWTRN